MPPGPAAYDRGGKGYDKGGYGGDRGGRVRTFCQQRCQTWAFEFEFESNNSAKNSH